MVYTDDLETMFAETNAKLSVIINLLQKFHPSTTDDIGDEMSEGNSKEFTAFSTYYSLFRDSVYTLKHKSGVVYNHYKFEVVERGDDLYDFIFTPNVIHEGNTHLKAVVTVYNSSEWVIKEEV